MTVNNENKNTVFLQVLRKRRPKGRFCRTPKMLALLNEKWISELWPGGGVCCAQLIVATIVRPNFARITI